MERRNVVIIGSGPAGYTSAIYAARANLNPLVYEGFTVGPVGGQLMTTTEIENFPGFPEGILGSKLMENLKSQATRFDAEMLTEDVISVDLKSHPFIVRGNSTNVQTNALIIATGATANRLDIPGARDKEFWQKGVTACAVCDGAAPIFREKDLFVVGGGDSAAEEALFLTKYASMVYLVHRRDQLRASKIMVQRVMRHPKVEVLWNRIMVEIFGDSTVKGVILEDVKTHRREQRKAGGIFFAIGHSPNTTFVGGQLEVSPKGYIIVKSGYSHTSREGVFAAGDVQDYRYRQAITAAGSGCMAAMDAERWLSEKGFLH